MGSSKVPEVCSFAAFSSTKNSVVGDALMGLFFWRESDEDGTPSTRLSH